MDSSIIKRGLVILFLIILVNSYFVFSDNDFGQTGEGEEREKIDPEKVEDAVKNNEPMDKSTLKDDLDLKTDNIEAKAPSGAQVSNDPETGFSSSEITQASTKSNDKLQQATNARIGKNGELKAASAEHIELETTQTPTTIQNVENFYSNAQGEFSFDLAELFQFDMWQMANAKGVEVKGSNVKAQSSDSTKREKAELTENTGINALPNQISIESSKLIVANDGKTILDNVKDTVLIFNEENLLRDLIVHSTTDNNDLKINDNLNAVLNKDSELVKKGDEFTIINAQLTFTSPKFTETITTTEKSTITLDFTQLTGFYSLKLSKDAEYKVEFKDDEDMNFEIIPKVDDYIIYIKKVGEQSFDFTSVGKNWAFVDFTTKNIKLNGLADFYKASGVVDSDFIKLIESNDQNNEFELKFDEDFVNFDLKLKSDGVISDIIGVVNIGDYKLTEKLINNKIHTIADFTKNIPNFIKTYQHEFNLDYLNAKISLVESKLIQITDNNEVMLFSSLESKNLIQEINDYKPDYCNQYNLYYNDNQYLPNYIDPLLNKNEITGQFVSPLSGYDSEESYYLLLGVLFLSVITAYKIKSNKKSQISLFIIVGVLLIIVFLILYAAVSQVKNISNSAKLQQFDTSSVKGYTNDCLNKIAQCSLLHQGLNYGFISTNNFNKLDKDIFQRQTKHYIDKVSIKCYDDMPQTLKENIKVNYFESNVYYGDKSIIDINTDMVAKGDISEKGISNYKLNLDINLKQLIDFANNIENIDLTYLGSSNYNTNVYKINDNIIYIITDPGSKIFDKEFKLVK